MCPSSQLTHLIHTSCPLPGFQYQNCYCLSHPGGFSSSDRACKPWQLITRLCHTPSPVSASWHTHVSFLSQIASEFLCYWRQLSQVLNTADDFLCVLVNQNHNIHLDFMTSFSDGESYSTQECSGKESWSCSW